MSDWGGGTKPYGVAPRSAGSLRRNSKTNGTTAKAPAATTSDAVRQPLVVARCASRGRKISCPVAPPAVRMPDTSPRRLTNQVSVTTAANTSAIDPVPSPIRKPQVRRICHGCSTNTLSALPAATTRSAMVVTARMPNRCISAAANGAVSP